MKKLFLGILVTLLIGLAACSGDDSSSANGDGESGNGDKENYTLKFGMQPTTSQNEYKAAEVLADYVKKESDGQLTVDIYPDAQLGDDREMLEQVQNDKMDITLAETGRFGIWVPRAELLSLPYMVDDFDHLKRIIYDTEYGQNLHKELEEDYNWKVMGVAYNGTRQTTSNRKIESLDDMEGLKLRVPEADTLLDYAEYTGAAPTPMAFSEVYTALQTNAVDGEENPLSTIDAQKFYEVQDYLAMTNHVVNDNSYVVSAEMYESLPEDLQTILKDGIDKAVEKHTEMFTQEEEELVSKFKEEGMTVTEPDLEPFREAVSEAYPEYTKDIEGDADKYLEQIKDARE
ncbi:sialic acid TRAP transporter substrate-binding protein SiaP [Lentibacillus cibarius]|uniref:DctP family TRAP transporter solute-binding subunit n=1 Tax=Lentibacillus cibarius TaxID=2583219 RepID=A0A5S3QIK5_9BACI|nr:sialic acid TRAP transporter substrate-binding protein SiaP [Lentibacillus cibarius]TMN21760.1 DctP family TRAP transporter solute-binding subunit [Lentibacillus cibarius]